MIRVSHRHGSLQRVLHPLTGRARSAAAGLVMSLMLLGGCGEGEPKGQVVAIVNEHEITVPELNAEARARGVAIGNDLAVRDALLQELIDRKLLVQAALRRELDRTPDYVLAKRRSDEILLSQQLIATVGGKRRAPSDHELGGLMRAKPHAFDKRVLLRLDRVASATITDPMLLRALGQAGSLDRAQALLGSRNLPAERRTEVWDSATLSAEAAESVLKQGEGRLVLLQLPSRTVVAHVLDVIPQPTPASHRMQFARELLQSERAQQDMQALLRAEKSSARIRYQKRFAPGQQAGPQR